MGKNVSLEQALERYRVMNTPTEFSWKQHYAKEVFNKVNAMDLSPEDYAKFSQRLEECQTTIAKINIPAGVPNPEYVKTLKDLVDTVVDPNNKLAKKLDRKVVFSTSNGERPQGKRAFEIWNGFQIIDLDIKVILTENPEYKQAKESGDKVKVTAMEQSVKILVGRVKNQIFQKLHTCNWFLGVGLSSSGLGLHVWTKINVPEETDAMKQKLLYFANFRHKYSYVYLAVTAGCELFNYTKDDVVKWMDLSMFRPQQGGFIGYDEHPLINSGFFEDFIYVNFDNVEDIGHPNVDWVTYPELKEIFKRWEWFEDDEDNNVNIEVKDVQAPEEDIHNKVHYKHYERWRLANTLVRLFDKDNNYQNGYRYLRMICSNAIKDKELLADCITAARHKKPVDPWAVQRLNSQHGFKIKLKITNDSPDGSEVFSSEGIGNPTLIRESPRRVDLHLSRDQFLGHIRKDILANTSRITLVEAGPGLGKTEMVKQLVRDDGLKIMMVMPFTSTIKSKVENDDKWYFSYGNRAPKLDECPGLALTIDKFSYLNMMDIKTAGFDYIFIDESHLLFLSEYRPVMSKVVDLIKNAEVPVILMSGTPCGELVFFPDATHIYIDKDDDRIKEFCVRMVERPEDLMFYMCRSMAQDIIDGKRILFPTNAGTLYSRQIEAAVNFFLRNDHQRFEPINLKYYKKSNIGEQFMDDVNFEKTIKDVDVLLCSNYLSVGVDVLDKFSFSIYFSDLILPHEIDQFCNRLRKNDLYAHLYVSKNDAEGNTRNLNKFKPLNFKLNEEEIRTLHSILRLCNEMIARNPVEYKYNSLVSSIIYDNKYIEYDNIENKYFLNETSYKILQFERKYRDYAQQLPVLVEGMKAYGYRTEVHDLKTSQSDEMLVFADLKNIAKTAYDEGLDMNTKHIEELLARINEENLSHYKNVLAGKFDIKKGNEWKDDISNRKITVKNIEVFEKVIPIVISLSKQYEVPEIRKIFESCRNSGGSYNFAAIGRVRMLLNMLYNDRQDRLDLPIKEFMNATYDFAKQKSTTKSELQAFIRRQSMSYAMRASAGDISIDKSLDTMEKIQDTLMKIFKSLITVSRPKKSGKIEMKKAELIWKERTYIDANGAKVSEFLIDEFLNMTKTPKLEEDEVNDKEIE